jgi:hypothetical protein
MQRMKILALAAVTALVTGAPLIAQENAAPAGDMQGFMKAMTSLMGGGTNSAAVVDFRELKALLPAELPGLKRTSAKGEKTGTMGMNVSYAEGRYEAGEASIEIKISDNGGVGFLGAMQTAWASQEIDSETDTGFERTAMYGTYKAKEEFDSASRSGKVEILVAGRFLVDVSGDGTTFEALQAAAKGLDLAKLATLQPKAAPPAVK